VSADILLSRSGVADARLLVRDEFPEWHGYRDCRNQPEFRRCRFLGACGRLRRRRGHDYHIPGAAASIPLWDVVRHLSAVSSRLSATRFRSGARGQDLLLPDVYFPPGDEPYRCSPGGKEVRGGNEFRRGRWQESPMPSEQANHHVSDNEIQDRVGGRQGTLGKEWKRRDLQDVGGDGYGPSRAVLRFQRFAVVEEGHGLFFVDSR